MKLAVLTGDIVDSSDMTSDALDRILELLDSLAWELSGWAHTTEDRTDTLFKRTPFARRGGDSWQIAMNRPRLALRASLYLQARIMAHDPPAQSRIAAATGDGTLPGDPEADLNSAHGNVFSDSGRLLDDLKGRTLLAHAAGGPLDAAFRLADHISQGWTAAQAQAVSLMLPPGSGPRRVAAEQLGISRQAVDQSLWGAGFPALEDALALIEHQKEAS